MTEIIAKSTQNHSKPGIIETFLKTQMIGKYSMKNKIVNEGSYDKNNDSEMIKMKRNQ